MSSAPSPVTKGRRVELFLAFLVLLGGLRAAYMTVALGYLPAPFIYDSTDTFADWYNVALWAHKEGAYDIWRAVYPPLSFLLIKYIGLPSCYQQEMTMVDARSCDWVGVVLLHLFVVVNGIIASISFMRVDRRTALPRAFVFTAGMPMLFALERGNIILICIACCMLAWGPLIKSARLRWLFAGLAVNFKVYLMATILVHLIRRRWLWVEGALITTLLVYFVTYALYGEGSLIEIVDNLLNFAEGFWHGQAAAVSIWYTTTYIMMYQVLTESSAPVIFILGSKLVDQLTVLLFVLINASRLMVLFALAAAWLRPEVVTRHRLTALAVGLFMLLQENPPYALPIIFFLVFLEQWRGWLVPMALVFTYLTSIPGELAIGSPYFVEQFSYIGQRFVTSERALQLGMFIRPLGHLLIPVFLSLATIVDVVRDIREDGWQWRWRFRRDAPILPRVIQPRPPAVTGGPG